MELSEKELAHQWYADCPILPEALRFRGWQALVRKVADATVLASPDRLRFGLGDHRLDIQ